jgi:predicted nucleotidyltransferase
MLELADYLEELFGRPVDLTAADWISPMLKSHIDADVIFCGAEKGAA